MRTLDVCYRAVIGTTAALWSITMSLDVQAADAEPKGEVSVAVRIDRVLSESFVPEGPGAAVLVIRHGEIVLRKGYGKANLELGVNADPEHIFRIGSLTKQFTAVAILQLAEAGKLRLDDDVQTCLPEYPSGKDKITIAHLLMHCSGIPSYNDQPEWPPLMRHDVPVSRLLDLIKDKPLDFAPGTEWKYCNSNYLLLGAVIEKISGESYGAYLQKHLFEPVGMTHTCYDSPERLIPGRLSGYSRTGVGWSNAPFISMSHPYAAGGLLSNVDDLRKWEDALDAGTLISNESLSRARSEGRLSDGRKTGYGFGWKISSFAGPTFEHGGRIPGFNSYVLRAPDVGLYIAILCNTDSPVAKPDRLVYHIGKLVCGAP
jgi:CubicO group peptidase (beta-lactamase class C family)